MTTPTSVYSTPARWKRLWRLSGINFIVRADTAYVAYGDRPHGGASADALLAVTA
jgi:hypothetical protein